MIASTMLSLPAFAVDGAGAKLSFFGDAPSTPYTIDENREDPIFSPYSPYGNGEAALYKKGNKEDVAFYRAMLNKCM